MKANKDKGTSVGFSVENWVEEAKKHLMEYKVCKEHEWVLETTLNGNSTVCKKCGESWPHIDFKIKENLEVIEGNIEDEFIKWLDLVILFNDQNIFGNPNDDLQVRLLNQVKEKYLEIKKKNT